MTPRHRHHCACGALLICSNPDQCPVGHGPFICPACVERQMDEWWEQYFQTHTPKEHTNGDR